MNVYLIGYRGSGKTSVAKPLGKLLGWETIDSDDEVEALTGTTISEIFESEGEIGFRAMEASVIEGIAMLRGTVVSLGGGAILDIRTRQRIRCRLARKRLTRESTATKNRPISDPI